MKPGYLLGASRNAVAANTVTQAVITLQNQLNARVAYVIAALGSAKYRTDAE